MFFTDGYPSRAEPSMPFRRVFRSSPDSTLPKLLLVRSKRSAPGAGVLSERDPQCNFCERHLRDLDVAVPAGLLGDPYESVAFQEPNVLLNVFKVTVDQLRKLV